MRGRCYAAWGITGVLLLLASATARLTPHALEAFQAPLSGYQWIALVGWVAFMGYSEVWKGFHQRFSPRVAARAAYLARHPSWFRGLLAPLFCMAFFAATRRRRIVSWSLTAMIVVLIVTVRRLPQPWRGIVDTGVVIGLVGGMLSIVWFVIKAFGRGGLDHPHEVE